jgi:hypothetical protein
MYYESIHSLRGMVFTELHIKKTVIMKKFAFYYPNQMSFLVLLGPSEQFPPLLFKLGSQYIENFFTQPFFKICTWVLTTE